MIWSAKKLLLSAPKKSKVLKSLMFSWKLTSFRVSAKISLVKLFPIWKSNETNCSKNYVIFEPGNAAEKRTARARHDGRRFGLRQRTLCGDCRDACGQKRTSARF